MKMSMGKWIVIVAVLFTTGICRAQLLEDTMDQYDDQSQGNYQPMNLNYAGLGNSIGMIQSAWQDPLQNLGEGQTKPAYSKYYWTPDLVLPIRVREGMITLVNFPEWELIENVSFGDIGSFGGEISPPNTVMLYPQKGSQVGVDSNVVINGRSGNKYVFYIKSEGVNTERLTNSIIDIDVVGGNGSSGDSPSSTGVLGSGGSRHVNATAFRSGGSKSVDSTFTNRFQKEDWLKSIPMDPTKFRFDIAIKGTAQEINNRSKMAINLIKNRNGKVFTAFKNNKAIAGVIIVFDYNSAILLHSWQNKDTERGTIPYLIYYAILWCFKNLNIKYFDFEGSVIKTIDDFFAEFNTEILIYPYIHFGKNKDELFKIIDRSINIDGRILNE